MIHSRVNKKGGMGVYKQVELHCGSKQLQNPTEESGRVRGATSKE